MFVGSAGTFCFDLIVLNYVDMFCLLVNLRKGALGEIDEYADQRELWVKYVGDTTQMKLAIQDTISQHQCPFFS